MTEQITTPAELDALPVGSVIRCTEDPDDTGLRVAEKRSSGWVFAGESGRNTSSAMASDSLPAMVLYPLPDAPAPSAEDREALDVIRAHAYSSRGFFCYDNREGRNGARCWWAPDPEQGDDYRDQHAQHLAAVLAARQPAPVDAETTTEWGIRHELAGGIDVEDDDGEPFTEEMAREYIEDYHGATLVSRQITPWREVPPAHNCGACRAEQLEADAGTAPPTAPDPAQAEVSTRGADLARAAIAAARQEKP